MKRLFPAFYVLLGLLGGVATVAALGWSPQLAVSAGAGVTAINSFTGAFTLGGGLSVNIPLYVPGISPWFPYVNQNVLVQTTGTQNVLRNATQTSWSIYKYLTIDNPTANPYVNGIASFTGSIAPGKCAGTTNGNGCLTVTGSPTGTIQLFQRITDPLNFTATAASAVGSPTLTFAGGTTGIATGMYATDTTPANARAIAGNLTVQSIGATTVTLTGNVGFYSNNQSLGLPGVAINDIIAFSTVLRGTMIVAYGTGTGGAGTYSVNISQTVASETMQSAGGWSADGVYVIPAGTAGTSSAVCGPILGDVGGFIPTTLQCTAGAGGVTDLAIRFPLDYVDASRINCSVYTGGFLNCVSSDNLLLPVSFNFLVTYSANVSSIPWFTTKISCPATAAGTICKDIWTSATTDISPVNLSGCNSGAATPVTCNYGYTWVPTGIQGDMEVEFHTGPLTSGQFIIIQGFELKQTPGATCAGTAPPCSQLYPGPIEIPEVTADIRHNARFAQLIGIGNSTGWNAGNVGAVETSQGWAFSSTHFMSSWPLSSTLRCDAWDSFAKATPTCAPPNVYFPAVVSTYTFEVSGPTVYTATGIAVDRLGANSIWFDFTSSGMTANIPGVVSWGSGGPTILLDSSSLVFGD